MNEKCASRRESRTEPESRVKFVISNRFDGLGGRIINLLYSFSLARWLGAEILIHWPNNVDLSGTSLNYLFADPLMGRYKKTAAGRRIDWLEMAYSDEVTNIRLVGNSVGSDVLERHRH